MNNDSHFYIGSTHKVCEDYAASGSMRSFQKDMSYAIVSDGCSSSPHSDFGSRILTRSAIKLLHSSDPEFFGMQLITDATSISKSLELPDMALDATLNIAWIYNDVLKIVCYGDGATVIIFENDDMEIIEFEYPSGAPLYLNYYINQLRYSNYISEFGIKTKQITNGDVYESYKDSPFIYVRDLNNRALRKVKAVFVISDGIGSFQKKIISDTSLGSESIPVKEVVENLFDIKGYQGEFLKRRFNGFQKTCLKEGWSHKDDMSVAGIYLG